MEGENVCFVQLREGLTQLAICIAAAILGIISLKMGAMHTQKHKKAEEMIFENFDLRPLWPYHLWPCGLCNLAEILHPCCAKGL